MNTSIRLVVLTTFTLLLSACGGSSESKIAGSSNAVPVANAGSDQKGKIDSVITLDGSASSDANSDELTYNWTLTSKPVGSIATLTAADTASPTLIPDVGGLYVASLIVNDGKIDSSSDSATITAGVLVPEYDADLLYTSCSSTYKWTLGPDTDSTFVTSMNGMETVNYVSGALTGTVTTGGRDNISVTTYNDGDSYKILRYENADGNYFLSTDCSLTDVPAGFSYDIAYNGMVVDQTEFYGVDATNTSNCVGPITQEALITIQDVTVQGVTYTDALLVWAIDVDYEFQTVSDPRLDSLGVVSPTSIQTGGYAVTDVDISAAGVGSVAGGDIDAATGALNDFAELTAQTCS